MTTENAQWEPPPRFRNGHDYPVIVSPDAKRADPTKSVPRNVTVPPNGWVYGSEFAQCVGKESILPVAWTDKDLAEAVRTGVVHKPRGAALPSLSAADDSETSSEGSGGPRLCIGKTKREWIMAIGSMTPDRLARDLSEPVLREVIKFLGVQVAERDRIGMATELFQWVAAESQRPAGNR